MVHTPLMHAISALFLVPTVIVLITLLRHPARAASGDSKDGSPSQGGRGQWLWAMVPAIILAGTHYALITLPVDQGRAEKPKTPKATNAAKSTASRISMPQADQTRHSASAHLTLAVLTKSPDAAQTARPHTPPLQ